MKSRLQNLSLPQSIEELSNIDTGSLSISQWSGAVNFLFVQDHLLLIKRSESMPSHKGQLGFVGGYKRADEVDPLVTAMREFEEETGLDTNNIEIFGLSPPVRTSSNNLIVPVITYIDIKPSDFLSKISSNGEWTEAILINVDELLGPELWGRALGNNLHHSFPIHFCPILAGSYLSKGNQGETSHMLWGATANMIWKFFQNYSLGVKS